MSKVGAYVLGTKEERYQWYDDMARGCRGTEPDVFYFNFAGYLGKFQFKTRIDAKQTIFEYIEVFYNRERIHSANDYMSPVDYEIQQKAV